MSYHLSTLVRVESRGQFVRSILECGHVIEVDWKTPERAQRIVAAPWKKAQIGQLQRCDQCGRPQGA